MEENKLKQIDQLIKETTENGIQENFLSRLSDEININNFEGVSDYIYAHEYAGVFLNELKNTKEFINGHHSKPVLLMLSKLSHHLNEYKQAYDLFKMAIGEDYEKVDVRKKNILSENDYFNKWGTFKPIVSIICTTYNHERYIEDTLHGFFIQNTSFPFEILIHDDASTDNNQNVIKKWCARYPNIIRPYLRDENIYSKGRKPLDEMFSVTNGKYIAICEGDDYWIDENKIQHQVEFLELNNDYICTAHSFYSLSELNGKIGQHNYNYSEKIKSLSKDDLKIIKNLFHIHSLVFRKVFQTFPEEKRNVSTGDIFITSYLGHFGKGAIFTSLYGSVSRRNSFSTWTPLSIEKKKIEYIKTRVHLNQLHKNLENPHAASILLAQAVSKLIDNASYDELSVVLKKLKKKQCELKAMKFCEEMNVYLHPVDLYREVAIFAESVGATSLAYALYNMALCINPSGLFLNKRIDAIKNHINNDKETCHFINFTKEDFIIDGDFEKKISLLNRKMYPNDVINSNLFLLNKLNDFFSDLDLKCYK